MFEEGVLDFDNFYSNTLSKTSRIKMFRNLEMKF